MPTRHKRRSPVPFLLAVVLLVALSGYFAWQSTRGVFGGTKRAELEQQRIAKQEKLDELSSRRKQLEAKTERLSTGAMDADVLDESARDNLNMAHPNELVIIHRPGAGGSSVDSLAAHGLR